MHREPDVGFDPRSPGSCPGPKAGAKPLRHPGIPVLSSPDGYISIHVRPGRVWGSYHRTEEMSGLRTHWHTEDGRVAGERESMTMLVNC